MAALEFKIDLSGNLAASLGEAAKQMGATGEAAKKSKKEFELFEGEVGKLSGSVGGLSFDLSALAKGGSLFTFDLAEGIKIAYEAVSKLVEKFWELGKEMVKVAGETQDLQLAVKLNVGDKQAEAINELGESFERTTRFDKSDMLKAWLPLIKQGIGDTKVLDTIGTIATDMSARSGGGLAEVQRTTEAFAQIFQRGRLKASGLAAFGIQAQDYFQQLAASQGISVEAAQKFAKAGKIQQDKLAAVAVRMIAARQGGAIGGPTLDAAQNLGGTLERLKNVGNNLFEQIASGPGMKALQDALDSFIQTMRGPAGKELMDTVDQFLIRLGQWLTPENVKNFVTAFTNGLGVVIDMMGKIVGLLSKAADIANSLGGVIAPDGALGKFSQWYTGGAPAPGGIAGAAVAGIPAMASGGIVNGPTLALIGEAGPEAVVPLSDPSLRGNGALGGGISLSVGDVVVHLPADANEADGVKAGMAAAQTLRTELKKLLDEIGWRTGATVIE